MKRFTAILLAMALLFCGCSVEWEETASPDTAVENQSEQTADAEKQEQADNEKEDTGDETKGNLTDHEVQGSSDKEDGDKNEASSAPAGAYHADYKGPEDRKIKVELFGDTAYYECDPYERVPWQPHIYSVPLDGSDKPRNLLKGELIALYDSVLLGKTDTHYCALDLSKEDAKWVELQSATDEASHMLWDEKIILFSSLNGKNYVDAIDIKSMSASRKQIKPLVRQCAAMGEQIYYTTHEKKKVNSGGISWGGGSATETTSFYCGEKSTEKSQLIETFVGQWTMLSAQKNLLLYTSGKTHNPKVYDTENKKLFAPRDIEKEIFTYDGGPTVNGMIGDVVYIQYQSKTGTVAWNYDLTALKDVEAAVPNDVNLLPNGYWKYNKDSGNYEYTTSGRTHQVYLGEISAIGTTFTANQKGIAHNYTTCITVGTFKSGNSIKFIHTEQEITAE